MKKILFYFVITFFFISCSSRDDDENQNGDAIILPKSIITKASSGDLISEYQYDGKKLKAIRVNNIVRSVIT